MHWADNGEYLGVWREGKRHGCGIFKWPAGRTSTIREYNKGRLISGMKFLSLSLSLSVCVCVCGRMRSTVCMIVYDRVCMCVRAS